MSTNVFACHETVFGASAPSFKIDTADVAGGGHNSMSLKRQMKQCGHHCYPSSTANCCPCMDTRPHLEGDSYPSYIDGVGWANVGARNEGYCPICNPKNYSVWEKKIQKQREEKAINMLKLEEDAKRMAQIAEDDRLRAAENVKSESTTFEYSNGDVYVGEMKDGKRHGRGTMTYIDGTLYEGDWINGEHSGNGTKNWGDGIVYIGQWKNGMMDGHGRYTMACGTVMEGVFREDEILEES